MGPPVRLECRPSRRPDWPQTAPALLSRARRLRLLAGGYDDALDGAGRNLMAASRAVGFSRCASRWPTSGCGRARQWASRPAAPVDSTFRLSSELLRSRRLASSTETARAGACALRHRATPGRFRAGARRALDACLAAVWLGPDPAIRPACSGPDVTISIVCTYCVNAPVRRSQHRKRRAAGWDGRDRSRATRPRCQRS